MNCWIPLGLMALANLCLWVALLKGRAARAALLDDLRRLR